VGFSTSDESQLLVQEADEKPVAVSVLEVRRLMTVDEESVYGRVAGAGVFGLPRRASRS